MKIRVNTVICFFFFFLISGCRDGGTIQNSPHLTTNDSVANLIQKSKHQDIDYEVRTQLLGDALEAIETITSDSLKTKLLSQLSLEFLDLGDSMRFRETNRKIIRSAKLVNDSTALAEAHWDLGFFFSKYAVHDSTFYNYAEAQSIYSAMRDDYLSARLLYSMATEQAEVKDYTGSELNTIRAIELFKPLDKYKELHRSYNNLGIIAKDLKEYDKALENFDQAMKYLNKVDDEEILKLEVLNNIGNLYLVKAEYSKAVDYFQRVISYKVLLQTDTPFYARTLDNLAYSKFKAGDVNGVEAQLKEALRIRDSIQDYTGVSRSAYSLADFYFAQKDTTQALKYAEMAVSFAKQSSNNERLLETLQLMTRIDPKNATAYSQEYIALNDSLQQEERQARNKFARIRFETDEFIAQNILLARQRQLWIGIAAGVLLLGFSIFIIITQRAKNQKLKFQQQQQESNQEIFNLMLSQNQKLEEGKQSEQKRISEELHDGILGQMNGIRMMLIALNKKTDDHAVTQRAELIAKLQEVQEEVRSISHELNDASYQKFHNFINSIEELLQQIRESANLDYEFNYNQNIDWDGLQGIVKINMYRVVQESLQNCVKHAQANKVVVDFDRAEQLLKITITDDGVGFEPRKGKKGIGHKNVTSRINKLNGTWAIESSQGAGTKVTITIPHGTGEIKNEVLEEQLNMV